MSARLAKAVAAQTPLIRKGFVMHVDPKQHDEYKRRHDQLWPDLREVSLAHVEQAAAAVFPNIGGTNTCNELRLAALLGARGCACVWVCMYFVVVDAWVVSDATRRELRCLQELERAGVHRYSIMLHPGTSQLFAFVEFDDEAKWDAIAKTEACQRWWRFMGDIMPSNADHSPVAEQLCEVFYMEGPGSDERA